MRYVAPYVFVYQSTNEQPPCINYTDGHIDSKILRLCSAELIFAKSHSPPIQALPQTKTRLTSHPSLARGIWRLLSAVVLLPTVVVVFLIQ